MGVCFGFGKKHFGASYHLRDECHIFNILGRRRVVNETWLMWGSLYIGSLMLIDNGAANNKQCMSAPRVLCSYFLMGS